jgi:hypothetical protein
MKKGLRQLSKGMGANLDSQIRRNKIRLLQELGDLDRKDEKEGLRDIEWKERYKIERELDEIHTYEESIWQKRCSERWILQGDANTGFFHGITNGWKRKCSIFSLETDEWEISDPVWLRQHIEGHYKNFFGKEERGVAGLQDDIWENKGALSDWEADFLIEPFSKKEIKEVVGEMKTNSAPRLDGLPTKFYKVFWDQVREPVLEMFDKCYKGELNLSWLNYGLISWIPKLKEANNIKQFRPLCLLGVDYKIFTKVLTRTLTLVVDSVICKTQTTFILGRNNLEGVVILHETLHELNRKRKKGIIMNLNFEKTCDSLLGFSLRGSKEEEIFGQVDRLDETSCVRR